MTERNEIFSFEFHSLAPVYNCKTIIDAQKSATVKLFGRTRNYESVCVHVIAHLPYFYILSDTNIFDLNYSFGSKINLHELGINESSFIVTVVEKNPFYNFHVGMKQFAKVECCSEFVRKRLVNFIKDSPDLYFTLYESHISFALQFMSDLAIVGMGLVHIKSPIFIQKQDKITTCDIECFLKVADILNSSMMSELNSFQSLLPSLSLFMENLGISDFNDSNRNSEVDILSKCSKDSLSDLWPMPVGANSAKYTKLKCPNFKYYTFRSLPPLEIVDYFPILVEIRSYSIEIFSNSKICNYEPVSDPPNWDEFEMKRSTKKLHEVGAFDVLTLSPSSKDSFPLYNYNGDFYLKIMALECYDYFADMNCLSTVSFSIMCGSYAKSYILTTIDTVKNCGISASLIYFQTELEMLTELINFILKEDPDILAGYEVDNKSWGRVAERFNQVGRDLNTSFQANISRYVLNSNPNIFHDQWIARASSNFQVNGRIVFNLWRIFKDEISIRSYSLSEVYKHYFGKNVPILCTESLLNLMRNEFTKFLSHILLILNCICDLITKTPFLVKSIEFSRLFGIDLFSTLTRGSQYRVESILLTAAHSENYLLRTPTESDVRNMRAAQSQPLTMEPISNYYRDPVVVLDFQSLYPSIIIAYNFCYSTIIGTMVDGTVISCGAVSTLTPKIYNLESISQIKDVPVFNAPGNIVFAKKDFKIGLIPRLLNEILSSRVAIKNAMKSCDKKVKSVLDARQLALKYISNVTYGYTSASFSGRMPNVDIADAIVSSGRKTLERAIDMIESRQIWEAKVVYGDTDSLFIHLPGRSLAEAFRLGREMAAAVSQDSPAPIILKFEKVYFPSVLMSKKRYCGFKHESEDALPVFDAKGIETVRRDGCMLSAKILEKVLMILFTRNDEVLVKEYVQRQLVKILTYQKINVSDFVFAREVRFGTYKHDQDNKLPLSAVAAKQRQLRNPRDIVAFGERVPFVIVSKPFSKLYQQVVDLDEFLSDKYRLDVVYYATKQIMTVLSRVFSIKGIDVWCWYHELPLNHIRNICNLTTESIFSRSFFLNITMDDDYYNHGDNFFQDGLKLQNLNNEDLETRTEKRICCGNQSCYNLSCYAFWKRFNFEHCSAKELTSLRKIFNLDF